jgi:hypothetical protein
MRYALLICTDESAAAAASPEELAEDHAGYEAFQAEAAARGVLRGGERLRPTSDATTVRVSNGEVVVSDGPFAETKEQMGGFYLVECNDLDEAIACAAMIPAAKSGVIEVRPIWDM